MTQVSWGFRQGGIQPNKIKSNMQSSCSNPLSIREQPKEEGSFITQIKVQIFEPLFSLLPLCFLSYVPSAIYLAKKNIRKQGELMEYEKVRKS